MAGQVKNVHMSYLMDLLEKNGFLTWIELKPAVRKGLGPLVDEIGTYTDAEGTYLNVPNNCYMVDMMIKNHVKELAKKYKV